MADRYFTGARAERYQEMIRKGDMAGIKRMEFGEIIYNARCLISPQFSQGRAAECAGMTRVQWNRIENGKVRPLPSTIPKLADALGIPPAILFCAGGYGVPREYVVYDRKKAHQRLDIALAESTNLAQFLLYMRVVWEEEQLDMMATLGATGGLPEKINFAPAYAELLAKIIEQLSLSERVSLAEELVQSSSHELVGRVAGDLARFYEESRSRMREYSIT
jgi:transcriptional regulator with XRE-family HTH domain